MGMLSRNEFYKMWSEQFEQNMIDVLLDLLGQTIKVDLSGKELPGEVIDHFGVGKISREPLLGYLKGLGHKDKKIHDSFQALAQEEGDFDPKASSYSVKTTAEIIRVFANINQAIQGQLPSGENGGGKLASAVDRAIEISGQQGLTFGENALVALIEIALADAVQMAHEFSNFQEDAFRLVVQDRRTKFLESYRKEVSRTEYSLNAKDILRTNGMIADTEVDVEHQPKGSVGDIVMGKIRERQEERQFHNQTVEDQQQLDLQATWKRIQKKRGV